MPARPTLDRLLRYVRVATAADDRSDAIPSTPGQLDLADLLADECRDLGLADVDRTPEGTLYATVPATAGCEAPAVALFAHVDTSPEYPGDGVKPQVIEGYAGGDIELPRGPDLVIRANEDPDLAGCVGHTLVTTDGTTLLGGDDKAGVAVIMTVAERLLDADVPHGPVKLCFTCDEEIGRGAKYVDLDRLGCVCGYTLDGGGAGDIDVETFSADAATVVFTGVNIHPSIAKHRMVNAQRALGAFLASLPREGLAPETTAGRDGFVHPYSVGGGVERAEVGLILRDFETEKLGDYRRLVEELAEKATAAAPGSRCEVTFREQYRNMREGLVSEPRAVSFAERAMADAGLTPHLGVIRGGTDGSQLTAMGLPTPNLSTGQHNPHSPLEWVSVEEMETAVGVVSRVLESWGRETA
ncbi:MAG: peptidase T [Planctomycetota bacterium]